MFFSNSLLVIVDRQDDTFLADGTTHSSSAARHILRAKAMFGEDVKVDIIPSGFTNQKYVLTPHLIRLGYKKTSRTETQESSESQESIESPIEDVEIPIEDVEIPIEDSESTIEFEEDIEDSEQSK